MPKLQVTGWVERIIHCHTNRRRQRHKQASGDAPFRYGRSAVYGVYGSLASRGVCQAVAIRGLGIDEFKTLLKENLTPARAISSPQHLKGREKVLRQIDRSFNSPGKHIFIYGDRGVGKTSLAQTAAFIQQSSDGNPILVTCGGSSFLSTIRDAGRSALPAGDAVFQKKIEHKLKAGVGGFGYDFTRSLTSGVVPPVESINDAVQLLKFIGECHSKEPVIILDEFDQLATDAERKACAEVIKQVSDQKVNVRFILCGIGTSLEDLIGVHLSTGRYLSPVPLERLTQDARWEIIQAAAQAVGVTVADGFLMRIGQISDGFPSYVHLMGEQLLWTMFDDEEITGHCQQRHFAEGVNLAVQEAAVTLKIIYDKATQKHSDTYQEVLWALADRHSLRRQTTEVYQKSYLPIMAERHGRKTLSKRVFSDRLNKLKTLGHGEIVIPKGAGWYEFKENIVRGYVRLRAENEGVHIGSEGYA
jgi:Cdc6-like AAA superfamily ATPase